MSGAAIATRRAITGVLLCLVPLAACEGDGPEGASSHGMEPTPEFPADPTSEAVAEVGDAPSYWGEVEPLLARECVSCHQAGGVAPFALNGLGDARAWGPMLAVETAARRMPPFSFDNSDDCSEFSNARWLEQADIDMLGDWVASGMPEGAARAPTENVALASLEGDAIIEVATPEGYLPIAEGRADALLDDYQCFLVDLPGAQDTFLTGYEVVPGDPALVHHLVAFVVDPEFERSPPFTNQFFMDTLDADSPDQAGWDCFGGAGRNVMIGGAPVAWAPGTGATYFPEGTGLRVAAGEKLVLQLHYNLVNAGEDLAPPPPTILRLQVQDSVERVAENNLNDVFLASKFSSSSAGPAVLEPGLPEVSYTWERSLDERFLVNEYDGPVQVMGILPHMHRRGRTMRIEFEGADGTHCGGLVRDWDFDWQMMGWLKHPITLMAGDMIRTTCVWDTSDDTVPVEPGFGTESEMCLVGLYIAPAP